MVISLLVRLNGIGEFSRFTSCNKAFARYIFGVCIIFKMKIAVDIDEVLADGLGSYLNYFNLTYGTNYRKEDFSERQDFWETLGVTKEKIAEVTAHYDGSPLSRDWYLIPGAIAGINKLVQNNELVIISNRLPLRFDSTRMWIAKNFPGVFRAIYFTETERDAKGRPSKAALCTRHGIEVLIEDNLQEAEECVRNGVKVVLFDNYLNQRDSLPKEIVRVRSWDEVEEALSNLTDGK